MASAIRRVIRGSRAGGVGGGGTFRSRRRGLQHGSIISTWAACESPSFASMKHPSRFRCCPIAQVPDSLSRNPHPDRQEDSGAAIVPDQQWTCAGSRRKCASSSRDPGLRLDGRPQPALASPDGQAAAADVLNFASGGVTLLIYDSKSV